MSPTAAAFVLALVAVAPASQSPVDAASSRATGRAVLVAANGTERAVALDAFELADARALDAALVRFEDGSPDAAADADAAHLALAGGEVLAGAITGGQGERVDVRIAGGLKVGAELEHLHALTFESRLAGASAVEPAKEGDRIYRVQSSGVERIDGAVEGFTADGVRFHGELVGTIAVPWRNVAALFVEHMGATPPAPDASTVLVALDLDDGSRVAGKLVAVRGRAVEIERHGEALRVPFASILQLARDDGSVAFLSSIAPASSEASRPFGDDLGMAWAARVDRNVSGAPLRAGGVRHPRGVGMHAPGRSTWALDGRWRALRGAVALDDEVLRLSTRGSCVFRVLLDGREAWASPVVRAGETPVAFAVELGAAKELALVVDPTEDGFAGDRADWLGLVLVGAQAAGAAGSSR